MDEIAVVVASLPALRFESFALHSPGAAGLKVSNLPDPATNVCGEMMSLDARTGGFANAKRRVVETRQVQRSIVTARRRGAIRGSRINSLVSSFHALNARVDAALR